MKVEAEKREAEEALLSVGTAWGETQEVAERAGEAGKAKALGNAGVVASGFEDYRALRPLWTPGGGWGLLGCVGPSL